MILPPPPDWKLGLTVRDRVSVPDGRDGQVIGFYMRDPESVLVMFSEGQCEEFPPAHVASVSLIA